MAKEKKMVEAITSMDEDFAQWYTDIVKKAELSDYSSVKGCMIIKPAGYAIWENIRNELDKRFKATGVENVYLPMFIPESLLEKEKDHVEVINNSKVSDHHAIIPTVNVTDTEFGKLPSGEQKVLSLITARLLSALGESAVRSGMYRICYYRKHRLMNLQLPQS